MFVYWQPFMEGLLHLVQRGGHRGRSPPSPLLAVPKVTDHPSTVVYQLHLIRCGTIIVFALYKGLIIVSVRRR